MAAFSDGCCVGRISTLISVLSRFDGGAIGAHGSEIHADMQDTRKGDGQHAGEPHEGSAATERPAKNAAESIGTHRPYVPPRRLLHNHFRRANCLSRGEGKG